mmetsp:Transcript_62961/g.178888  ORF Transcript_62961/g.178888 Transcript_62961/m.178888 type:complete len:306 (-) Transcript_62961:19-936(-)
MAPHLLQRPASPAHGAGSAADGGCVESQGQQRTDDPDHVRDLLRACLIRLDAGRPLALRLGQDHRHRLRQRRRRDAHRAHLRGLRHATRHLAEQLCRPRPDRLPYEDDGRAGPGIHDLGRAGDSPRHQGEVLLCGGQLRSRGHQGGRQLRVRGDIRAARRPDRDARQRALPLPRGALPAVLPRPGGGGPPGPGLRLRHGLRRGRAQGALREHRARRRHVAHRRPRGPAQGGGDRARAVVHGGQGHRSARAALLRVDRGLHHEPAVNLRRDVDHEGRVRREWAEHRAPQVYFLGLDSHGQCPARGP